jgi:hypothetical protein
VQQGVRSAINGVHNSALPAANDEAGARQNCQMRRHGILRHADEPGDVTGGEPFGFVLHQGAERLEAGFLCERGKGVYGGCFIHIS